MGASEGKSMLYLEARCIAVTRAAASQGVQNGGIDGVNVTASVPDGMREVIAENLCVMLHDLESCTGNDTLMSASDIRRTAHTFPLLLAGSDFLFSGFGSIPAYDNAFGPSNMNAEDLDDYLVVQRDWGFEGGLPLARGRSFWPCEGAAPRRAAPSSRSSALAEFSDEDVEACVRRAREPRRAAPAAGSPRNAARSASWSGADGGSTSSAPRRARIRGRGRARARDDPPAPARRHPPDLRDPGRGDARPLLAHGSERLRGTRDRLPHVDRAAGGGQARSAGLGAGRPRSGAGAFRRMHRARRDRPCAGTRPARRDRGRLSPAFGRRSGPRSTG